MPVRRKVAVLSFHKIGPPSDTGWKTWFYIPTQRFREFLERIALSKTEVIDLDRFVSGLSDPGALPARSVLITFDDAYANLLDYAVPELERMSFPSVVFAPTDHVGADSSAFDGDSEPTEAICGWDELAELESRGAAVQSHGATHRPMSALDAGERREDLVRSRAAIEERLQRPVYLYAFPYGDDAGSDPDVRQDLVAAGYRAAFLYGGPPLTLPAISDFSLPRVAMSVDTDLAGVLDGDEPDV